MTPFDPLIAQPRAVELLHQAIARQRIAPAYLFAGPDGVGRSLAALCFAELLLSPGNLSEAAHRTLCHRIRQRNHPDLLWVEPTYLHQGKRFTTAAALAADVKSKSPPIVRLDQVREIGQFLARSPLEAPRSLVVIEQAETMAEAPANALLKTLEEPGQATLILLAPGIESLLPTLVSRCQRVPFYRLSPEAMAQVLQTVGQEQILQQPQVLQLAQGSPGAAIAHWQQLQTMPAELLQMVAQPPRSYREALSLARQIDQMVEPEAQLWLIDYLQQNYWQQQNLAAQSPLSTSLLPLQLLEKARQYLKDFKVNSRLVWEVTLLGMVL